jgi:hypothetical protein
LSEKRLAAINLFAEFWRIESRVVASLASVLSGQRPFQSLSASLHDAFFATVKKVQHNAFTLDVVWDKKVRYWSFTRHLKKLLSHKGKIKLPSVLLRLDDKYMTTRLLQQLRTKHANGTPVQGLWDLTYL